MFSRHDPITGEGKTTCKKVYFPAKFPVKTSGLFRTFPPCNGRWTMTSRIPVPCCACDHTCFPPPVSIFIVLREWSGPSAEPDALCSCRRNVLLLALVDRGALVLCHEGQHLQNDIAEKSAHQVFAAARIQKRHIRHHFCKTCAYDYTATASLFLAGTLRFYRNDPLLPERRACIFFLPVVCCL